MEVGVLSAEGVDGQRVQVAGDLEMELCGEGEDGCSYRVRHFGSSHSVSS